MKHRIGMLLVIAGMMQFQMPTADSAPTDLSKPVAVSVPAVVSKPKVAPSLSKPKGFAAIPATFCRYVPEREDDFAWENDRVAFRVYGPALLGQVADSGIDCWPKRVEYPIINRWYAGMHKGLSYHDDHGEGCDNYHVGRSRGCGGTALWMNEQMVTAGLWTDWHVEACGRDRSTFTLIYRYPSKNGVEPVIETKTISIAIGEDWFTSTSVFTQAGKPYAGKEVVAGLTTHDGKGLATLDPEGRWVSVWEDIKGLGPVGTGLALPSGARLLEIRTPKPEDSSHVIAIMKTDAEGRLKFRSGFCWTKAGRITSPEDWQKVLAEASKGLQP